MGSSDIAVAAAILLLGALGVFGIRWLSQNPDWARFVPGAAVTLLGILLLIAFYRWWFDVGNCEGRGDVVCITNQNQGVLTLVALLVAGLAVWVEFLARNSERLRLRQQEEVRVHQAVAAAIDECHHNLIHAALCFTGATMTHLPWGLAIDDICALTQREYRHLVDEDVLSHIDPIRRNFDSVRVLRARFDGATDDDERERARARLLAEPHQFGGLIVQSLGFLRHSWIAYRNVPGCRDLLEKPGLQDLPRLVQASRGHGLWAYFRTSDEDAQSEAAKMRTQEGVVACWLDDQPLGVTTYAFGPRFMDAAEAHVH